MTSDEAARDKALPKTVTDAPGRALSTSQLSHLSAEDTRLIALAISAIGGRWVLPILTRLCVEPTQFNQLQRDLAVSSKVLTSALRAMARDGLVVRTPPDHPGSKGSYSLTQRSTDLQPALAALHEWVRNHGADLDGSRTVQKSRKPGPGAPVA